MKITSVIIMIFSILLAYMNYKMGEICGRLGLYIRMGLYKGENSYVYEIT